MKEKQALRKKIVDKVYKRALIDEIGISKNGSDLLVVDAVCCRLPLNSLTTLKRVISFK